MPAPGVPNFDTKCHASPTCTSVAATSVQKKMVCARFGLSASALLDRPLGVRLQYVLFAGHWLA